MEKLEIKDGIYICKINKIEYRLSNSGKELCMIEFEITDENSEYFKKKMYMNQFINSSFGIHLLKEFLRKLDLRNVIIDFDKPEEINDLAKKILEETKLMEFDIEQITKGIFKQYEIKGIYDLIPIE